MSQYSFLTQGVQRADHGRLTAGAGVPSCFQGYTTAVVCTVLYAVCRREQQRVRAVVEASRGVDHRPADCWCDAAVTAYLVSPTRKSK